MTAHRYSMTASQALQARQRVAAGESIRSVAQTMGLPRSTVGDAVRGRTWSELDSAHPPVRRDGTVYTRTPQRGEAGYVDPFGDVTPSLGVVHQYQKQDHQNLEMVRQRTVKNEPYIRSLDTRLAGLGLDVAELDRAAAESLGTVLSRLAAVERRLARAEGLIQEHAEDLEELARDVDETTHAVADLT